MSEVTATGMHKNVPECALRVLYILSTLFSGYVLHTGAGRNSTRSPSRAISQGLKHGRVRVEACAFLLCIYKNKQFLCPNRVSMDTLETI